MGHASKAMRWCKPFRSDTYSVLSVIFFMNITLINKIPLEDGFYFVKFGEDENIHFVEVLTVDNKRVIKTDSCPFHALKEEVRCRSKGSYLYFNEFPDKAYWSDLIIFG